MTCVSNTSRRNHNRQSNRVKSNYTYHIAHHYKVISCTSHYSTTNFSKGASF